jgi:hypothetical protein
LRHVPGAASGERRAAVRCAAGASGW